LIGLPNELVINMIIEPKFESEVKRLMELGYQIVDANSERVLLSKWKWPPLTFLLYFLMVPLGWFWLVVNTIMGYRFHVELWDVDGKIELRI